MNVKGYSPSHITGFFEVVEHRDPGRMGSRGAGVALRRGAVTTVVLARRSRLYLDGVPRRAVTTRSVVEALAPSPVVVRSYFQVPMGCGLGASAAGALSTARALDGLFHLGRSPGDLAGVAHRAEVENRTGLGTVTGIYHGGLVVRLEAGAPGPRGHLRVPLPGVSICWVAFGPRRTSSVLRDPAMRRLIIRHGRGALREMVRRPTLGEFFRLSRGFAVETGLASARVVDAIEAVEAAGGMASMAMLGDTVFARWSPRVERALAELGRVKCSPVSPRGFRGSRR